MKRLLQLLALCSFAVALPIAQTGCTTAGTSAISPDQTKLLAKVAVQYAVLKVAEKHPDKAAKILEISHAVRAVAGSDGFNTVDLLMDFVRVKANIASLSPADQLLAGTLLDAIQAELKAKIGNGTLTTDKLLIVGEVAGWIEDAAKLGVPHA